MATISSFKKTYRAELRDVDFKNELKVSALFGYLQDAASLHAEKLNVGYRNMTQTFNATWVLMRARLEIEKIPTLNEEITIETWPQTPRKLDTERDFLVWDTNGDVIARASSVWVALDLETRRLTKLDAIADNFPETIKERALSTKLGKLKAHDNLESVYKKVVGYSDIDVNGHLNNTKYVDYIMDCFPLETHKKHRVAALEINFTAEALPGSTICLSKGISDNNPFNVYVEGSNEETKREVFRSQIEFV